MEFQIDDSKWGLNRRDLERENARLTEKVRAVNHGEFEEAVTMAMKHANDYYDARGGSRPSPLVLQRCRRGGKTFMLHSVAARLQQVVRNDKDSKAHVIFISMNSDAVDTRYDPEVEDALQAILVRIAYEYSGAWCDSNINFVTFRRQYSGFQAVQRWVRQNHVILLVDKLNVIPPEAQNYRGMANFLDLLVSRQGSALIYSTHKRETAELLRYRLAGQAGALFTRVHQWLKIPRVRNENCLRGLFISPNNQPTFWSAVLRGRIPALIVQEQTLLVDYGYGLFPPQTSNQDRMAALKAVITGEVDQLQNQRSHFKAYSYMSERFIVGDQPRFAWPPFLIAQEAVLGKDCTSLRTSLEDPMIDEAKAFEALTQLAVLVRLLSAEHHHLVPHNSNIPLRDVFQATEILHICSTKTTIADIVEAVRVELAYRPEVLQVVAVPYFQSFPVYDFFVLHKVNSRWIVAAGYQCKQGTEGPKVEALEVVGQSVWIEGKCRKYRALADGRGRVEIANVLGWQVLSESYQAEMLGVSVSEALPAQAQESETTGLDGCLAEQYWELKTEAGESSSQDSSEGSEPRQREPSSKKTRAT
jgi:hypothetical protein